MRTALLTGIGLGLLNAASFALSKRGIGVSSAFESGAAIAARRFAPDVLGVNDYLRSSGERPEIDWESYLVLGTAIGGFLAARAAPADALTSLPNRERRLTSTDQTPAMRARSWPAALAGGALTMFGARMAGGCTSGHCLTGTANRSASSWLFTPLMFGAAVAVADVFSPRTAARSEDLRRRKP